MTPTAPTATTLCISSFHPFVSRNILATELLNKLAQQGIRSVILVPARKQGYFEEEFGKLATIVPVGAVPTRRDRFLNYLSLAALRTRSLSIKRITEMQGSGAWLSPLVANRFGRTVVRWLHRILTPQLRFNLNVVPDLVFATDMNNTFDLRLIEEARRRGVPVVGMMRSWDNLTSKGLLRTVPDVLVVHSAIERQDAIRLHGVPERRVRIVGIPHYDRYVSGTRTPRKDFFAHLGIGEDKRLVVYAPTGDRYLANNTVDLDIVELLDTILPPDCHLLVRLPPTDRVASLEEMSLSTSLGASKRVTIERPTTRFGTLKNVELAPGDDDHLADTLYWSDLVVSGPSTVCIDAAFFDKPAILIGFDGKQKRSYYDSVRRYYDYDHWKPVLVSGGVRFVESEAALEEALKAYLDNPKLDAEGRERMVSAEASRHDGRSTARLAAVIMEMLPAGGERFSP